MPAMQGRSKDMTYYLIVVAAVLLAASWLSCIILALNLREARRALMWRNIENAVLVRNLDETVERARKAERVLEAWAKSKPGQEPKGSITERKPS